MFKKIAFHPVFIFLGAAIFFYWPLSLQLFTLKNDALTYYYPVRTLISDALNNLELPLWTPFINFGYPLHADMQSAAWNPIVWVTAFLTGYSLAGLHVELVCYLCIAGFGVYKLAREFGYRKSVGIICGLCYEFSGCLSDSAQFIACFSSAAYLPWIFVFFKRTMQFSSLKNSLGLAFVLYLMFTGGYPSMFIITLYLLLAYFLFHFFSSNNKASFIKRTVGSGLTAMVAFTALSLPAIISFTEHLSHISRSKEQPLAFVLENSLHPGDLLSFIVPFAVTGHNEWLSSSAIMRNVYIGILPLVFVFYALCNRMIRNNKEIRFLGIAALAMLLIALGEHFVLRQVIYYVLPGMDRFRHPALFRIFSVLLLTIIAGAGIQHWIDSKKQPTLFFKRALLILSILGGIFCMITFFLTNLSFRVFQPSLMFTEAGFTMKLLLQGSLLLIVSLASYFLISRRKSYRLIAVVIILDLFLAVQLQLPVTVIGAKSFSDVETIVNRSPEAFPIPGNEPISENVSNSHGESVITGSTLPFTKKIGRNDYFITPGNLALQDSFYESALKPSIYQRPVLSWAEAGSLDSVRVISLSANTMEASVMTSTAGQLIFLQNYYPGWLATVDAKKVLISATNISFMKIDVPAGRHSIHFTYQPEKVIWSAYFSLLTLVLVLISYCYFVFSGQRAVRRRKEVQNGEAG